MTSKRLLLVAVLLAAVLAAPAAFAVTVTNSTGVSWYSSSDDVALAIANTGGTTGFAGQVDFGGTPFIIANTDATQTAAIVALTTSQLKVGYRGGTWTGQGIISSLALANTDKTTTIAIITGSDYNSKTAAAKRFWFQDPSTGLQISTSAHPTWVLMRYALMGDTNCDGILNFTDTNNVNNFVLGHGSNAPGSWLNGDFNHDGIVNFNDSNLLNAAALKAPTPLPAPSTLGPYYAVAGAAQPVGVPEPSTFVLLAGATASGLVYWWKKRRGLSRFSSDENGTVPLEVRTT